MESGELHDQTIAVTGAGGFIGSHLAHALLRRGARVRALVRYSSAGSAGWLGEVRAQGKAAGERWTIEERLQLIHGDVLDARCVHELVRECDQVFHLAALIGIPYSYRAPSSYLSVNVEGTLNVLEACRDECPERLIVTSTSEVYGSAQQIPMSEAHPLRAQSPYAASKIASDKLAESYHLSFNLPVATLRPFNAYGPRQSLRAVVPTILAQLLSDDCEQIHLGSVDTVRDVTFVEDTAAAFVALATAPLAKIVGKTFNAGSGQGLTVLELAEAAMAATGRRKPVISDPGRMRPGASEVTRLVADASLIQAEAGWKPAVELKEGLLRTAEWISARPHEFDAQSYRV